MYKYQMLVIYILMSFNVFSQIDSIPFDNSLEEINSSNVEKVFPTIIVYNLPTTTVLKKGEMKLYLAHRMGTLGTGVDGLFGLYQANSRIGADLGINKFVTVGIGTTSQQKYYDGYFKCQLTKQSHSFPFESAIFSSITFSNLKLNYPEQSQYLWQRIMYFNQIMLSRLILNNKLALQLNLSHVHKNMVKTKIDRNDIFSIGSTVNLKLNRMFYLATEYMFLPSSMKGSTNMVSHIASVGVQIHTGPRHVFQIFLSNSVGILPPTVISETNSNFIPKNIRISFNIPTTFQIFNK
ncbi:MAG: DUF5777 family beta-barrel protein [Bacteroidales bacterium]|nr:DUF5777 family beta-barrel protein [Bacteroidales bacterium]